MGVLGGSISGVVRRVVQWRVVEIDLILVLIIWQF